MSILIALTLSIGVLSVVATWLFLGPLAALNCQIWQAFLGWACFYHCGGKTEGLQKTAICMSFGALIGVLAVLLAGQLGALGALAAPVAVGIGAAVIVIVSQFSLLATIPACVYGFGAAAGLMLLKGTAPLDTLAPTIGSVIVGALFGWVSEAVAGKLAKA